MLGGKAKRNRPRTLPHGVRNAPTAAPKPDLDIPLQDGLRQLQQDYERRSILMALDQTGGNKARAAALLGISRNTLFKKLKEYKID